MTVKSADVGPSLSRSVMVLNRLAASYLLFGQLTKARSMIKLSLSLSDDNPNASQLLAIIDQRTKTVND